MSLPEPRADWALFLDFDGTLVDIADRPDAIVVDPGLPALLSRVTGQLSGALAVVSGRPIAEIDSFLQGAVRPVAGMHGVERREPEGDIRVGAVPVDLIADARAQLTAFAADHDGVLLEDKRFGLVLHYRLAPDKQLECEALTRAIAAGSDGRLKVQPGKMVSELKASDHHKGEAVRAFMAVAPFRGRTPVFAGDDITDEDAFAVVNEMGGVSIRVGPAPVTAARYVVDSVESFRGWLREFADGNEVEAKAP